MATTLSAGDIAIIGFNFDNPDEFSFVLLTDITAGTEITFTDNGWQSSAEFRATEGTFTWTATSDLTKGTVINPTLSSVLFSASGDQIIAYQGSSDTPTFIYALNSEGSGVWQADATSSNTSALPTGLTNGETAVALDEIDNAVYTGTTSGTKAELLADIGNKNNWTGSNSQRQTLPAANFTVSGGTQALVINEVLGSTNGSDVEYIELFGEPGTSLDGYSIIVVEGDAGSSIGSIDKQIDLGAEDVIGDNGFFLIGNSLVEGAYAVTPDKEIGTNSIENSSYTIALVETSSLTGSSVSGNEVVVDAVGVTDGGTGDTFFFNAPVLGPDGNFLPAGVRRVENGVNTNTAADWVLGDFFLGSDNTPTAGGSDNGGGGGEPTLAAIYEIQGAAHTSLLNGELVSTFGVVTAVDSNGFYLQDALGDGDDATSDAIFVFTDSAPTVIVGNSVEVTGTVSEFFPGGESTGNLSTTQISNPTITIPEVSIQVFPTPVVIGAGGRVPPNQNIDDDAFASFDPETDGIDFFESIEGMLVTAQDAVAVAPTNRFGEIFTVVDNGTDATGISDRGTLNISPDDFNPEKVQIDLDPGVFNFSFPNVNVGDSLGDVTGVVSYSFGNFEIIPTEDFTDNITSANLQPETTTIQGTSDKLTVASYNLLNLDPNDADGDTDVANGRFNAIASQIVTNLNAPDIIGLQEIQDNNGSSNDGVTSASDTLQDLIDAIATAGGPTYSFIDNTFIGNNTNGGQPGGNIRTAFLYNSNRVNLVNGSVESIQDDDQQSNPDNPFFDSRLPIVAKFTFNGEEVTVVNNHFSSKGGSAPILGIEQPFEARQEEVTVNGSLDERQDQAQAVKDYVDGIVAVNPSARVVVLGDLNEFEFVSPVTNLAQSLTNLTETVDSDERYSFIFQGNSQSLDHILVSDNLAGTAEFDIVHVNSEFAETDQRASDHDPLVAALSLPGALVTVNGTAITNQVESYGGNQDNSSTGNVTVSPSNQLNISGNRWQKVEINSTITPNTVLNFTFGGSNGEIQGIGFDNNNVVGNNDRGRFFQVGGSQSWGIENLSEFIVGQSSDGKDIYSIPVGQFFTGDFEFLTFANDDDQANPDAEAQFSNIELFEAAPDLLNISIDEVNQDKEILSYGGANQNKGISSTVSDNGTELKLEGNGWRKVDITGFEVTGDSILSFEVKAQNFGEIQGIGFDNNDVIGNDDRARFFQVAGTQDWGIDNLADYTDGLADADGFIEYSISVGDFFTGEFDFLTFGNDHDVANPTAIVEFRNISLI